MRKALLGADRLVAHNLCRYDIPVAERILGIKIKAQLVDTLPLAWYLSPDRPKHNLDSFGQDFGIPKPKIDDWDNLSLEEYIHRCEQDVRINTHLWNAQFSKLKKIYENEKDIFKFIDYLSFKMHCAHLAEASGWKVDLELAKEHLEKLELLKEEKTKNLGSVMPRIPVYVKKTEPKILYKKDGSLSAKGQEWYDLLKEKKLPLALRKSM